MGSLVSYPEDIALKAPPPQIGYKSMEIRRVSDGEITHKEFYNEYWKKGIPLVFKDCSKKWKASGTFTPEYFRKNFGDRRTVVNGVSYTMNEILDLVEGKDTSRPVPYPSKYHVRGQLPELGGHMDPWTWVMRAPIGWRADGSGSVTGETPQNCSSAVQEVNSPTSTSTITT